MVAIKNHQAILTTERYLKLAKQPGILNFGSAPKTG